MAAQATSDVPRYGDNVTTEKLPAETTRHFDRDPETNEVLWFAGPPLDIAHPPGPQYSLEYLHFLAQKRKKAETVASNDDARQESPQETKTRTSTT